MGCDVSRSKVQDDFEDGKKSQKLFSDLMEMNGYRCYSATTYEDKYEHWDVLAFKESSERFDVKKLKSCVKDGYEWIEFQTVDGRKGWILSEFMDTLAFELEDCFIFVNRAELLSIVEKNIGIEDNRMDEKVIYFVKEGLQNYQRYQRRLWNKIDISVKSPIKDFEHLISRKLYKIDGRLEKIF